MLSGLIKVARERATEEAADKNKKQKNLFAILCALFQTGREKSTEYGDKIDRIANEYYCKGFL
jgi:hypothetical protein